MAVKAAEMAGPGMDAKQQELTLELPSEPAMVDGDEIRLAQILSNILNNASLYSPAASHITLALVQTGSEYVVSVSDPGIGMSAKTIATAFDMFVQGSRSQELGPGGLGMGLSVARALADAHGGRITAESEGEGLGSRFFVRLPVLIEQEVSTMPPATATEPAKVRALRVLVVDDNADLADAMGETLRSAGHDVQVVYHPAAALDLAPKFTPQVALLDLGLPTMNGYQLADRLRTTLSEAPRMIAMSGFGQARDHERSRARGFQAHFVKPADLDRLLEAVAGGGRDR